MAQPDASPASPETPHFSGAFWAWRFSGLPRRLSAWWSGEPVAELLRDLQLTGNEQVLDAGCGAGFHALQVAQRLPQGRVTGLDPAPDFVARLKSDALRRFGPGRVEAVLGSAQALPLADASQDAVYSVAALHHMPDPKAAVAEMLRVLKPGGRLILVDWHQLKPAGHGHVDEHGHAEGHGHGQAPAHRVGRHGHRHDPFGAGDMEVLFKDAGLAQARVSASRKWVYGFGVKTQV